MRSCCVEIKIDVKEEKKNGAARPASRGSIFSKLPNVEGARVYMCMLEVSDFQVGLQSESRIQIRYSIECSRAVAAEYKHLLCHPSSHIRAHQRMCDVQCTY